MSFPVVEPPDLPGSCSEVCDGLPVLGLSPGRIFKWKSKPLQREVLVLSDHIKSPGYKSSLYGIMSLQHYLHYICYVMFGVVLFNCMMLVLEVWSGLLQYKLSIHFPVLYCLVAFLLLLQCEIWLTNGVYFQKYIYDHRSEDCLLSGFQGSRNPNPFRERSSCNVL